MRANHHIMGNLHLVIDDRAGMNFGVFQCATIDSGIGANIDIVVYDDSTKLGNFTPVTALISKAKTVATDDCTAMDLYAIA